MIGLKASAHKGATVGGLMMTREILGQSRLMRQ